MNQISPWNFEAKMSFLTDVCRWLSVCVCESVCLDAQLVVSQWVSLCSRKSRVCVCACDVCISHLCAVPVCVCLLFISMGCLLWAGRIYMEDLFSLSSVWLLGPHTCRMDLGCGPHPVTLWANSRTFRTDDVLFRWSVSFQQTSAGAYLLTMSKP